MSSTTLQPLAMIYPSIPVLAQRPEPPQLVLPGNYVSRWGLVSGRLAPTRHAASVTLEGQSGIIRHHTAKWIQTRFLSLATGRFFQSRPHAVFVAHDTDRILSKYFRDMNIVDSDIRARVDQSIKPHVSDDSSQPGSNQSPLGSLDTLVHCGRSSPQLRPVFQLARVRWSLPPAPTRTAPFYPTYPSQPGFTSSPTPPGPHPSATCLSQLPTRSRGAPQSFSHLHLYSN